MEEHDKKWSELSDKIDKIMDKYNIDNMKLTDDESMEINTDIENIYARFDGERLFDTEVEELEDLECLIKFLEDDLKGFAELDNVTT